MDNVPIFIDTEPETSMEQDGEARPTEWVKSATLNATKSLFNTTLENFEEEEQHESVVFKEHEMRLQHEMKDWKTLIYNAYHDLKQSKQKHPTVDKSILPLEKRQYLEKAPCLQTFIRESMEFRRQAHQFLNLDYEEFMEVLENLEGLCEHRLDLIKSNIIAENLANTNNNQ